MEDKNVVMVPFYVHESSLTRMDRVNKRLWILCIGLILLLVGTNAGWLYYESQWETVETTTVTQDVEATAEGDSDINLNTVGGDYHGRESESTTNSNQN